MEILDYAVSLDPVHRYGLNLLNAINLEALRGSYSIAKGYGLDDIAAKIEGKMELYYTELYGQQVYR
jgi:hypothetical protein